MSPAAFSDEVVAAVCDHMNHDHPEDCLLIVQGLAGRTEATSARMVSFDRQAADFVAVTPVGELATRVPFSEPVHERAQIRAEVVRMYHEACAATGLPPRRDGEH